MDINYSVMSFAANGNKSSKEIQVGSSGLFLGGRGISEGFSSSLTGIKDGKILRKGRRMLGELRKNCWKFNLKL
jgi:hypothetical protein